MEPRISRPHAELHGRPRNESFLSPQDSRRATSVKSPNRSTMPPEYRRSTSYEYRPKLRWPPQPTVEDEAKSLLREHSPLPICDPDNEVASRGRVDQVPIMEDTEVQHRPQDVKEHGSQTPTLASGANSGSDTPASAEGNSEWRYVLVSKSEASDVQTSSPAPQEPKRTAAVNVTSKRARSSLRIDPSATDAAYTRSTSTGPLRSNTNGTGIKPDRTDSPVPMSASRVNSSRSDIHPPEKEPVQPRRQHRHSTHSSSTIEPKHSTSLPRPPSSASSFIEPLIASVRNMHQTFRKEYEAALSDTSSRGGRRGRDQKSRSRTHSFSSSDSEREAPKPVQTSGKFASWPVSTPNGPSQTMGRQQLPPRHDTDPRRPSVAHGNAPLSTPTNLSAAGWNGTPRPFAAGTAIPQRSPVVSPGQSPANSQPPSPVNGHPSGQMPGPQSTHSRHSSQQSSRPVTPAFLSPTSPTPLDGFGASHFQPPQHAPPVQYQPRPNAYVPGQTPLLPNDAHRHSTAFVSRPRPESPLPPHHPGVASHSGPRMHSVSGPLPSQFPLSTAHNPARMSTSMMNGRVPASPALAQPRAPTVAASALELDRQRRAIDPAQAVIWSRANASSEMPKLPPCPRPSYSKGYNDWSTLPGHPDFDICPTCRKGLQDAGMEVSLIPTPSANPEVAVRCDMSIPWVRMAWLLLLQRRTTHPTVIHEVTSVLTHREPCPGRELATRKWHRLYDWENERYVSNFDACPRCVQLVEALFPNLQGVFELPSSKPRESMQNCDLRIDSRRFVRYVDLLDNISHHAQENRREPNTTRFVTLAKKLAAVRECREDDQLRDQPWHYMPQLPDFTVCEECYRDVVLPQIKGGSELAADFHRSLRPPLQGSMPLSCQLYSPRMRELWARACHRDDFELIRSAVTQRVVKERELQTRHARIQHLPEEQRRSEGIALVNEWRHWA